MSFVTLTGTLRDGRTLTLNECIDFSFSKDRYSATQVFDGKFVIDFFSRQFSSVSIKIMGHTVLTGYVEKQDCKRDAGLNILTIRAKSYSSLLESNHIQPGVYNNLSIPNTIINYASDIRGVSLGPGSDTISSIVFADWTTVFDAVRNISIRVYGVYPFVTMGNQIRTSMAMNPKTIALTASKIIDVGEKWDTSSLISTIYMKDINGNPAAYSRSCAYTQSLNIVRKKHIALMTDWLDNINAGLEFKLNMARKRCHTYTVSYNGYNGEDIYDTVSFPNGYLGTMTSFLISAIEIKGNDRTIKTSVFHFDDYYNSVMRS